METRFAVLPFTVYPDIRNPGSQQS